MVNHKKQYNWNEVQKAYDDGLSWRKLSEKFGMGLQALANARKRGDLNTHRTSSEATSLTYKQNNRKHPTWSNERRLALSERQSTNTKGGKCKWFTVSGQKVQGTWELNIAKQLDSLNIKWIKLKTNKDILKYEINGMIRSYSPDFYLPEYDLYLEIKGFWWPGCKEKMDIIFKTYPNKNILVIEKEQYDDILKGNIEWLRTE